MVTGLMGMKRKENSMSNFSTDNKDVQKKIMKHGVLCDGNCGRVFIEEDLHQSCYGDLFCNKCMFIIRGGFFYRSSCNGKFVVYWTV